MPSRFTSTNVLAVSSILWIIFTLEISKCSEVIDELSQKDGLYMSDYCPKIASCPEGSHVMCMFYNPNSVMGPRCSNLQNISITPDIARKMLDISNAVRSKIALGKETGKHGNMLPKGYGLFRLKWDSELATFAQVLANQCVLRHDICRASKKFPYPGQTAGLVRFSNPHWYPVSSTLKLNDSGLTKPKVIYATTQSVKSWYSHKDHVTHEMISDYPDWTKQPGNTRGKLYLELIYGPATHMGCGISAYSEYAYHVNAKVTYNSIQTICNFSSRPRKGKAVYQSTPPTGPGYTARCGCPEGYEEGADCLCSETSSPSEICGKKSCNPNVVLLPIFTVEDAPRSVLLDDHPPEPSIVIADSYRRNNSASIAVQDNSIDDIFGPYESYGNSVDRTTRIPVLSPNMHYGQLDKSSAVKFISETKYHTQYLRSTTNRQQLRDVKNRYFNKQIPDTSQRHPQTQFLQTGYSRVQNKIPTLRIRPSLFSRSYTFHLPRHTGTNSISFRSDIKRDVTPRKNFTKGKQILSTYLTYKHSHERLYNTDLRFNIKPNRAGIITTTEIYNKPSTNSNQYLKNKFNYQDFNISHQSRNNIEVKEADIKLMTLLNTLEQEVKHTELIGNKKKIFDAKIRKIYDTILNEKEETNLNNSLHARTELYQEDCGYNNYVKYETDVKNHSAVDPVDNQSKFIIDKHICKSEKKGSELNSKLSERYSDPKSLFLKKTKSHDSVLPYDENNKALVTETDDPTYPNSFDRIEMFHKSMMKYGDTIKNILDDEDLKIKNYRNDGQESVLQGQENTNNNIRNTDKRHDYDDSTRNHRNFNQNEIKPRNGDKNFDFRSIEKRKHYNYRDTEKRYDENLKNSSAFRQQEDLKNRAIDKTIDGYRHTKKRSSDDNMKIKNQLRQFVGDRSFQSRNVYRNNEGRSLHNYDDELMKRHNYEENLTELRGSNNLMQRDRPNEFRSRAIDNGMRNSKSYMDYGNKELEISHGDSLGFERRKFYQNKLDNIEKKINSRSYRRLTERDKERALRLDRPHQNELHIRPNPNKGQNQFYIPDRARILHGF